MNLKTSSLEELQARAAVYRMFSESFIEPFPKLHHAGDWEKVLSALPGEFQVVIPPPPSDPADEFRRIFGHNLSPDCPPYETHYEHMGIFRKTQELADLAGFYRAFGLETADGDRRADHLPVELEFVSLLCLKEALAVEREETEKADICRRARERFLGEHLCRWLSAFTQAVNQKAPNGYFARLSAALAAFARIDAEALGVDLAAPRPRPTLPDEPEDVCISCIGGPDDQA